MADFVGMGERVHYPSIVSDNARWDALELRSDDIVISTPSKCGTTWTQRLVSLLVFDGPDLSEPLSTLSPWVDMNTRPIEEVVAALDAQTHRRFLKTHTPLDGLDLDDRVTYIGVGRDPRDAAVSMAFHGMNMDRERFDALVAATVGEAPVRDDGPGELSPIEQFRAWMTRPAGLPDGRESLANILHHVGTLWEHRHRPNVALFHYADYQADLPGELCRLGEALGIDVSLDRASELAEHASLDAMRARAAELAPNTTDGLWKDDARFFRAGGRGEWQALFTEDDHRLYDERVAELAPADLAAWAHHGRTGHDPT